VQEDWPFHSEHLGDDRHGRNIRRLRSVINKIASLQTRDMYSYPHIVCLGDTNAVRIRSPY
jgi:hypothetical protein